MARRATASDVARLAGVSRAAVSFVLNGRMDIRIPDATRKRVLEAANQLGYTRNAVARALATGRTERVGIVGYHASQYMTGDEDYYLAWVMRGVMRKLYDQGLDAVLHIAHRQEPGELTERVLGGTTDGVLLIGRERDDPVTLALMERHVPFVCINYAPGEGEFWSVDCDNEQGGYLVGKHLLELGHRDLLMMYRDSYACDQERRQGVLRAMAEAGVQESRLELHDYQALETGPTLETVFPEAFALHPEITAVVLNSEWELFPLYSGIQSMGLRVPEDLSVVTFNSTVASSRSTPPATSVYQPLAEIGERAAELLGEIIAGKDPEPGIHRFPVRLDVRESTAPPRR